MQTRGITLEQLAFPFFHMSTNAWLSQCTMFGNVATNGLRYSQQKPFHTLLLSTCSGDHPAGVKFPDKYDPRPRVHNTSLNRRY